MPKNLNITIISFLLLQYVGLCKTSGAGANKRTDHASLPNQPWSAALNSLPTEIFTTGLGGHVCMVQWRTAKINRFALFGFD
jgi:hypothetical protein